MCRPSLLELARPKVVPAESRKTVVRNQQRHLQLHELTALLVSAFVSAGLSGMLPGHGWPC
jgi:hypothetical protein